MTEINELVQEGNTLDANGKPEEALYNEISGIEVDKDLAIEAELEESDLDGSEGSEGFVEADSLIINSEENELTRTLELSAPSVPSAKLEFPSKCYHCNFTKYETKQEYESHYVLRHSGKTAYPGPADSKQYNLNPHNMPWEKYGAYF